MTSKKQQDNNESRKGSSNALLAVAAVLVLGLIAYVLMQTGTSTEPAPASTVQEPPVIPTMDPAMFTGKTRDAYQAAKDVPEVLAKVPCYCGCMENSGHQHNLHCFIDEHAVG